MPFPRGFFAPAAPSSPSPAFRLPVFFCLPSAPAAAVAMPPPGPLDSFTAGNSETLARQRKADELPREVAALYAEVRAMRSGSTPRDAKRLTNILDENKKLGDELLLREEVEELLKVN